MPESRGCPHIGRCPRCSSATVTSALLSVIIRAVLRTTFPYHVPQGPLPIRQIPWETIHPLGLLWRFPLVSVCSPVHQILSDLGPSPLE
eukprot:3949365-Pyramimonas_sp.AAC.1